MTAKRQMVHTSCINGADKSNIWVCYSMCLHIMQCNICFHPSGIWCLESSWADWLPSDVTISLCAGRFGLWSLCQQRKAGGNRPQGQKKGCDVWIGYPLRPSILLIYPRHHYHIADIHWQTLYVPSSLSMFSSLKPEKKGLKLYSCFELFVWYCARKGSLLLPGNILSCSSGIQLNVRQLNWF